MLIVYRILHLFMTGFMAFIVSIPFLEGRMDQEVVDDGVVVFVWLVGAVIIFNKKVMSIGFILTTVPFIFFLLVNLF